ncbi:MAG: metalloregulator ArsR/SmtB family transcription factor [Planctomycetota bacterium]
MPRLTRTKQQRQKPSLRERPPLTTAQVGGLRDLFKILASETRLRLIHALVQDEERCVSDLAEAVGMKPQAVSNQLQRLLDRGIVASRREGSNVFYRIDDPCVAILIDRGLCLLEDVGGLA